MQQVPPMTERQQEIKALLDQGMGARQIARKLGISRNAIYQQIQRLRRDGHLAPDYTPTGQPVRTLRSGPTVVDQLLADGLNGDRAPTMALAHEIRRTRDELNGIVRRLTEIVG